MKRQVINTTPEVVNSVRNYVNSCANPQGRVRSLGEFVERAVQYLSINHIDLWLDDPLAAPYQEQPEEQEQTAASETSVALVSAFQAAMAAYSPESLHQKGVEYGRMQAECERLREEHRRMGDDLERERKRADESFAKVSELEDLIKRLESYKARAKREFERIEQEQSFIGKVEVRKPFE